MASANESSLVFFFPAPLLLTLKASVHKLFFSFPPSSLSPFTTLFVKENCRPAGEKSRPLQMSEIKRLKNAASVQPSSSVLTMECTNTLLVVFFVLFVLLHRTGNKESPICLAAGELNESFYGLPNVGEWERGTCNNIYFNPGRLGSGLASVRRPLCFSSGRRRGAGGRISRGSSGVQAWIRPTAAAGWSRFRFTADFWHWKWKTV